MTLRRFPWHTVTPGNGSRGRVPPQPPSLLAQAASSHLPPSATDGDTSSPRPYSCQKLRCSLSPMGGVASTSLYSRHPPLSWPAAYSSSPLATRSMEDKGSALPCHGWSCSPSLLWLPDPWRIGIAPSLPMAGRALLFSNC